MAGAYRPAPRCPKGAGRRPACHALRTRATRPPPLNDRSLPPMSLLVLLRHGQSQWNLEDRFTGWVDVDLTPEGEAQARRSGELIRAEGLAFDLAFSS